jgi:hybrid cluster-associated redox disulfide protein
MDNQTQTLSSKISVADLLELYPQAIPVFLKHGMSCVGCSMSAFETLEDAARIYGVDISHFLEELTEILKVNPVKQNLPKPRK